MLEISEHLTHPHSPLPPHPSAPDALWNLVGALLFVTELYDT